MTLFSAILIFINFEMKYFSTFPLLFTTPYDCFLYIFNLTMIAFPFVSLVYTSYMKETYECEAFVAKKLSKGF